jgi:hypothetical protein
MRFGREIVVGDVTGDGIGEIVAATESGEIGIYDAVRKTQLTSIPSVGSSGALLLANLDTSNGTALEIVAAHGQGGQIDAYRYVDNATPVARLFQLSGGGLPGSTVLGYGNVDGDAEPELVLGAVQPYVVGLDAPIGVDWPSLADPPPTAYAPFFGGRLARGSSGALSLLFTAAGGADATVVELSSSTGTFTRSPSLAQTQKFNAPFVVADYDNDQIDEVLVASDIDRIPQYFAYDFFSSTVEWQSAPQTKFEDAVAVATADFTNDGQPDFVVLNNVGRMQFFDVYQNEVIGATDVFVEPGVDVMFANLDGDAALEVLAASSHRIAVLDLEISPFSLTVAASYHSPHELVDVAAGDFDGDGTVEVFAAGTPQTGGGSRIERFTAGLQRLGEIDTRIAANHVAIEHSSIPRKNLLVATSAGGSGVAPPALIAAFDPISGFEVWRSPGLLGTVTPNSLTYLRLQGESRERLAFATTTGMYLTQ